MSFTLVTEGKTGFAETVSIPNELIHLRMSSAPLFVNAFFVGSLHRIFDVELGCVVCLGDEECYAVLRFSALL